MNAKTAVITRDAPAFDFYPERWLVGVAMLSDAEQIAYLRLLCHQWMLGDEGLPGEVAALKRLAGKGVTPALMAKFPAHADGRRRNGRLEIIRQEQRARIVSRRLGAALTHARRYGVAALGAEERALLEQAGRVVNGVLVASGGDAEATTASEMKARRRPPPCLATPRALGQEDGGGLAEGGGAVLPGGAEVDATAAGGACSDGGGAWMSEDGGEDVVSAAAAGLASNIASMGAGRAARGVASSLPPPTTHRPPPTHGGTNTAGGCQGRGAAPAREGAVSTPGVEAVRQWAAAVMAPPDCAEAFWNDHEARGWSDKTGQPIVNFRAAFNGFATRWKSVQAERAARVRGVLAGGGRNDSANRPGRYG